MADHASRGGESMPKKGGAKTSKRRKGARAKTRTRVEAPLNPEQILRRENIAASAAIPSKIADRLTTRRILISGTRETIALNRREDKGSGRGYEIVIPKNAVVGLPGKTAYRMVMPRGKKVSQRAVQEGFRPKWFDHVYHPKRAAVPRWAQRPGFAGGRKGELFMAFFPRRIVPSIIRAAIRGSALERSMCGITQALPHRLGREARC
jgi:hypothetical protein